MHTLGVGLALLLQAATPDPSALLRMRFDEAPKEAPVLPLEPVYRARAGVELGLAMLGGVVWYWSDLEFNAVDWDLRWDWPSWKKKLTFEAVRLDTNTFNTNVVMHPWSHAGLYLIARGNRLRLLPSFLITAAASTAWEYLVEFREVVSLNDLVVSPVSGFIIGESFFQLGEFFRQGDTRGPGGKLAVLSPVSALNDWISGRPHLHAGPVDRFGFRSDIWHRFDLAVGLIGSTASEERSSEIWLGVDTQIRRIRKYLRPVDAAGSVGPARVTDLAMGIALDEGYLTRFDFESLVWLSGYRWQRMTADPLGRLVGSSLLVGAATSFEHEVRAVSGHGRDQLGVVHVAGPMAELSLFRRGFWLRLDARAFGDIALVRSWAIDRYLALAPDPGALRGSLAKHGYYYALGVSPHGRVRAGYGRLEIGAEGRYGAFDSIEGLDRNQEEITNDIRLADQRSLERIWVAWDAAPRHLRASLVFERYRRAGAVEGLEVRSQELRSLATVGLVF